MSGVEAGGCGDVGVVELPAAEEHGLIELFGFA